MPKATSTESHSHKPVSTPLREKCQRDNDPHPPPVARRLHQAQPAHIRRHLPVKLNRGLDLGELILHERIVLSSVRVVVCENFEGLRVSALRYQPTRGLGIGR